MYIGVLEYEKNIGFTHINSDIEFPPIRGENGSFTWNWEQIYDTGVDISLTLEKECYVGAVNFSVSEASLANACVVIDGAVSGSRNSSDYKLFGGDVTIPVGVRAKKITLRLFADFQNIEIRNIELLGAYGDEIPLVYPTPKSLNQKNTYVHISCVLPASDDPDEIFAADFLRDGLGEKLGKWQHADGVRVIIKKNSGYDGERYTVKCTEKEVTVSANSRISLLYGTDTLLSLSQKRGLYLADVDDAPTQKLRGFHFGLPHKDKIEFTRRLMRYVLIPMRYNTVFLEFAGGMRFDSHPEISEAWIRAAENAKAGKQPYMPHSDKVSNRSLLEKDTVRELVKYIKELGLALIPEVQSLAHVQYITYAHPEIAELDNTDVTVDVREGADARPEKFYAHSYCPENPKSYEIIYDIIDEIIDVCEPSGYVHMGHDEVYQIGLCEKCRNKHPSELFANHVNKMHAYLAKKGLKMMMWSDMLHPAPVTDYLTYKAIDSIPKDIIMLDFIWYFHPNRDIEDTLLSKGFKVAVGNLYSSHYPRFKSRVQKSGMIGGEVSMWLITDEDILAKNGKLWDIMYLSEMLWNTDGFNEFNRKTYTEIISKHIQPATRDKIRGKFRPCGYSETRIKLNGCSDSLPHELLTLCPGSMVAESIEIELCDNYERLIFEHATLNAAPKIVWLPNIDVGEYIIEYEDGETAAVQIRYAENVMCYKSGYAIPKHQQYYRHFGYVGTWLCDPIYEGKNLNGEDISILGFVWENPHPEKKITKITYKSNENDYCKLVIAGLCGLK